MNVPKNVIQNGVEIEPSIIFDVQILKFYKKYNLLCVYRIAIYKIPRFTYGPI